ncbi:hypothetical protein [Paraburkholderia caledonica]|uniref:Uncharacterized protein n=1 Tax=Paraburkholderia caledonica TaxID=134536 RepID=A0AB73IN57_9BURK|nr:hypothetical protein [Paraburkholderia caledonica]
MQLVVRRPWMIERHLPYWIARCVDCFAIDFLMYGRLARNGAELLDFHILPRGSPRAGEYTVVIRHGQAHFKAYAHPDLKTLLALTDSVSTRRATSGSQFGGEIDTMARVTPVDPDLAVPAEEPRHSLRDDRCSGSRRSTPEAKARKVFGLDSGSRYPTSMASASRQMPVGAARPSADSGPGRIM